MISFKESERRRKIKENNAHYWHGKKFSLEMKNKMSKSAKNPKRIAQAIKNLPKHYWLGKKLSEKTKKKIRIARAKRTMPKGKHSYNWKGGISKQKGYSALTTKKRKENYKEKVAGRPRPKKCEVCGSNRRICFDHNHITGKFRGWICHKCNVILGMANDNKDILQKLIFYLNK